MFCVEQSLRVYAAYRVSSRDSGKTAVDAALGEVMVTCEKIWWLLKNGQKWLKPEYRSAGIMVLFRLFILMPWLCTPIIHIYAQHAADNRAIGRISASSTVCLDVLQYSLKIARLAINSCAKPESSAILFCVRMLLSLCLITPVLMHQTWGNIQYMVDTGR